MLPLYLPATADAAAPGEIPVFYGAVTLYLRHKYRWLQKLPRSWFKPLDSWPVLKLAAGFAGSTSATGLEDLTLSMLRGMEGQQADELEMLSEWIESLPQKERPEVVILSNALLTGLAQRLKVAAKAPILCWLQDEHVWTDAMHGSLKQAVIKSMHDNALHVDHFIAVSNYYRDVMSERLAIRKSGISVIYPGVNLDEYTMSDVGAGAQKIGFLSRLSQEDGFETFVDAFIELRKDPQFKGVKAAATGGPSPDKNFLKRQQQKLSAAGVENDVEISLDRFAKDRFGFLSELTILSVPGGKTPEAFGYYAIEALASGVPVVLPNQGAFPEFVSFENGGVLLGSTTPQSIAKTWSELLRSDEQLKRLSANAQSYAKTTFDEELMAENIIKLLQRVLELRDNER